MQTVWENCDKRNSGPVNFIVESRLPLSCTNQFRARKPESGVLKMVQQINTDFCLEHSVHKRQDYLFRRFVAPLNFSPERHEKQCPIHFSIGFSVTFLVNGKQPWLLPSETDWDEKKKFGKCNGNLRLARALRSSSTPPGFFYFRRTNDVRSFAACFNIGDVLHTQAGFGQTRSPVMGYWSDRIKTSQKEAFPLVEVELKRPDENSSLF